MLDAISGGLRTLPSVDLKELARMADFAEWGEATSRGLGWGAETFLSTYNDNRRDATAVLLEQSAVAIALLAITRNGLNWSGKPLELYNAISKYAGKTAGTGWPKSVHTFGNELRRIAPQLRLHGISINFERRLRDRIVTLKTEGATPSRPSTDTPTS